MSQYPQCADTIPNLYHFMHEVSPLWNLFKQTNFLEFKLFPLPKISLKLLGADTWKNIPLKEMSEIVIGLEEDNFQKIIEIIQKLSMTTDRSLLLDIVTNVERAFNISRLAGNDPFKQLKIEDMSQIL